MNKILTGFLFISVGLFIVAFVVMGFAAVGLQHFVGSDTQSATSVAQDIGMFTVPSGFKEHSARFNLSRSTGSKGGSTAAIFIATGNRNVNITLEGRLSDAVPSMKNARAAFVKKVARFCIRFTTLPDDQAVVYGKPLSLFQMSCVLRNRQTYFMEGAIFAKMRSAGNAGNKIITVFSSGPESVWDPEPLHALLASLH